MSDLHILFIGATVADARDFIGFGPNHVAGEPAREDRPSQRVPDDVWPPSASAIGYFWGLDACEDPNVDDPGEHKYGLIIITPAASSLIDPTHPWLQEHRRQGGNTHWPT